MIAAALVQRPRRKVHLAAWSGREWWPVCDVTTIAADAPGLAVTALEEAVGTIDAHAADVCAHCRRLILMADVAHRIGVGRLVAGLEVAA